MVDFGIRFEVGLRALTGRETGLRVALFDSSVLIAGDGNPAAFLQPS